MFDKEGNLANWWSQTSFHNFQAREECLVKQYSADCSVQGHKVSEISFYIHPSIHPSIHTPYSKMAAL